MPFFGHGHHPTDPQQLMYRARCDECGAEVRFTTAAASPADDLSDMDWVFGDDDCTRLLCSDCNPKAPGNHAAVPSVFRE